MYLKGKSNGERVQPLDAVTIVFSTPEDLYPPGMLFVKDGLGREYARILVSPYDHTSEITFKVGGALGHHQVYLEDKNGHILKQLSFRVEAKTKIADRDGQFSELLQMLYYTMVSEVGERRHIRYKGRIYSFFICWLRDHVHVLKGMKYFADHLKDGIDLYRDSQRQDGMIWDNVYPRQPASPNPNHWDVRFAYGDFTRPFDDYSAEFHRIPVENDVEYLFVEGLYATWKATGDDGWMARCLDAAIRAMEYSITSPYRWSSKHQLLKRGHTIDTWDFQNDEDCLSDFVGWPDPMAIHPDKTKFGIMFGDNTGYAMACDFLAEMLQHAGRSVEATTYQKRGAEIRQRLDALSWNGRFFTHHVPEDPSVQRDLGVEEDKQVSLSNAYSLNRGLPHEQCAAIISTYLELKDDLPPGSPGEWYTIYPPFQKGYGGHNAIWQYMNASVTPIVAGELAHGAFRHGFEGYAVNILLRLIDLGKQYGGTFHSSYTGALLRPPQCTFTPLSLAPYANADTTRQGTMDVPAWPGDGDLSSLPTGRHELAGIPFNLLDPAANGRRGCIGLSARDEYDQKIELPIHAAASAIYLLHTLAQVGPGEMGGRIVLHYADGSSHSRYIVDGDNVLRWNHWEYLQAPRSDNSQIAWRGYDNKALNLQVVAYGLDNPHPERTIEHITLDAADNGTIWYVLGLTLSDGPVYFAPGPISFGIPNGWGAAAVVYALVEGLAGVVDTGVAFQQVALSPRWPAAEVDQAKVVIHYPASDGYVAYRYQLGKENITLDLTGSGESCQCHLLLPPRVNTITGVTVDSQAVDFMLSRIEQSRYVDFKVKLPGPRQVVVKYQ